MQTLMVTGASGFLGYTVCAIACRAWRVVGVVNRHRCELPGVCIEQQDLTDRDGVAALVARVRPDAVIHCAAMARPDQCEADPAASRAITVDASAHLAVLCAARGIPLVFTSTDLVFDGQHAPYDEQAAPAPVNLYGRHKLAAEQAILQSCPQAAVCRMPLMFGDPSPYSESFLQPLVRSLRAGQSINLFVDEYRSCVSAATAAQGLVLAIERRVSGLLHLGGRERVSRCAFGEALVRRLRLDPALVRPLRQADLALAAPRPPDVSLDSRKAFSLGYAPGTLSEELDRLVCLQTQG